MRLGSKFAGGAQVCPLSVVGSFRRVVAGCAALAMVSAVGGCGSSSSNVSRTFAIGRSSYDWADSSRAEKFGPSPGAPRKIAAYVWYPAEIEKGSSPGPFVTDVQATAAAPLLGLSKETIKSLPTRSYMNAPVLGSATAYPVLIMSHGAGNNPLLYSNTAEFLASKGYIVVGITHTYNAQWTIFTDGTIATLDPAADPTLVGPELGPNPTFAEIDATFVAASRLSAELTKDATFVLDKLTALNSAEGPLRGRLNLAQVGMFGHSFGGSHSFRMLKQDSRVLAAADLDGTLFTENFAEGTTKPFLVISSARPSAEEMAASRDGLVAGGMTPAQADMIIARNLSERKAFENSANAYYLKLNKALHSNFSDIGLLSSYGIGQEGISTTASAASLLNMTNDYLLAFFDEKLRGSASALLRKSSGAADVIFEKRP